ncbi:hypothetical protein [Paenibacillus arenilitoris]|uniref:Uncharacterized protein n=1 Tax=Paenibacillus arenilitoris TaxID=2772299 RepID=A0A927HAF7_9BACL|nr:hypothetical protein [Paenibacillus arenilitoris]MBD2872569.1 hypothetical protein [Paenibacillus arenilitoris]
MREITIEHYALGSSATTAEAMAELAGGHFPIADRVPGAAGEAFDWHRWHNAWLKSAGREETAGTGTPTHLAVEAADGFEATIPWEQLTHAAVLFAVGNEPLSAAGPIRLYVPSGSSKCLNVKSIVKLKIGHNAASGEIEASYGFKRTFSADDLRMKK